MQMYHNGWLADGKQSIVSEVILRLRGVWHERPGIYGDDLRSKLLSCHFDL